MPLSSVVGAQSIVKPGVCTSSTKPASPYDGQVIYMTDVDQTAVWDGSSWVVLSPITSGRNVIINGAMQVAQRATSTAGITGNGYHTVDRFQTICSLGTWTQSVETDAPSGSGFRRSTKMLVTTANASPSAGNEVQFRQIFEGLNLQQFAKGTASAKKIAVSFWVKSNKTGTYVVELYDTDNNRHVSATYTINGSDTWEKKTIIFPEDTTGAFDNDNIASMILGFWLAAGSNFTSGTLPTVWGSAVSANRAVGQTNLGSATNNYWQITGVQLEPGAVATPFEFEDYGTTLAKCQRYYQICYSTIGQAMTTTTWVTNIAFPVEMRSTPSVSQFGGVINITLVGAADYAQSSTGVIIYGANRIDKKGAIIYYQNFSGISAGTVYPQNTNFGGSSSNGAAFSAEL
jgi:hypothetical protein